MEGWETFGSGGYGDRIADVYDELYAEVPTAGPVETTVGFLAALAGSGPALELGIGTGRVALPLQAAGVEVHGVDASERMVARMRAKPGGDRIPVTMGDFVELALEERFALVYVAFNTFFGLISQEDQITGMRSVAHHLLPGGAFVIEAFVPDPSRFERGQRVSAIRVEPDLVALEVTRHDPIEQRSYSQHVLISEDGIRLWPVQIRYAFVAELDLMARRAGLRLRERWADWDRTPFSSDSPKHISVYELDPGASG
jgi:ubiquinone/menaquinone biosynthesis C-methylase UbiE